ncbi:TDP-N-acetylfucosamine:lipid II N-acetylfucosaminyltransferase family protein [Flavobacterium poyangense]|uniref:TDP-N-acetylfucosamine:lipid II N-acetylfucosaminyltransferase n=1 Tax=Flavobacterium poyangense TaxID=2204302 RepID=UPI0014204CB3|nr:TDP-N-acetylfucosamine:lipid II N-acetylfucosaminyltransferase [Flavobacterium sp. JXAS1]
MSRIIHICEDEKFINSAIEQFENCFPDRNVFHVVSYQAVSDFLHVKSQPCVQKCLANELVSIGRYIQKTDIIILHSLSVSFYEFVLQLPKENPVVWFCFGFEVYNDTNYYKAHKLFDSITRSRFSKPNLSPKKKIKEFIRPYYRVFNKNFPLSQIEYKRKVMKRIDFLGSSFEEEFQIICGLIKQKKCFFAFWYYPLEQILDISKEVNENKKTILIGNSGSITGNHLDVFDKIKEYNLTAEKIIAPLNYGDSEYINIVTDKGYEDFPDKFWPLLEFISLDQYNTILQDVGVAIFNNRRQQALGNIIALLWMGAKVFLSKLNTFYTFLKRTGIHIYCYETDLNEESCNEFLSLEKAEHNRAILFSFLNKKQLEEELKEQIAVINV